MGFNMKGNIVAEIFMVISKIIAGVLRILLFGNYYSRALDNSKPNNNISFSKYILSYKFMLSEMNYHFG